MVENSPLNENGTIKFRSETATCATGSLSKSNKWAPVAETQTVTTLSSDVTHCRSNVSYSKLAAWKSDKRWLTDCMPASFNLHARTRPTSSSVSYAAADLICKNIHFISVLRKLFFSPEVKIASWHNTRDTVVIYLTRKICFRPTSLTHYLERTRGSVPLKFI